MRFTRTFWCSTLAISQLAFTAISCPQAIAQRKRVAVLNFEDDSDGSADASKVFGVEAGAASRGVSAQLIEKLTHGEKYTVVDRSALKQLMEEQATAEDDHLDAYGRASKIGRMLGLDSMIIGAITRFGPEASSNETKSDRNGMSTRKSKAYVDITTRVLDMTTGEVIGGFMATGESAGSGTIIRIAGRGASKVTQEMLGSEFVDSLFGEATRNAVDKIAEQLNSFADKIPALKIEFDGLVAEVAENLITLNVGRNSAIRVGDRLTIFREVRAVTDPATGGSLPPVVEQIGEATVTEVADAYSTATFSGSGQAHVGDRVRHISYTPTPQR
jgi:curli biogenesis system outer membrane secretion channel CsgG